MCQMDEIEIKDFGLQLWESLIPQKRKAVFGLRLVTLILWVTDPTTTIPPLSFNNNNEGVFYCLERC